MYDEMANFPQRTARAEPMGDEVFAPRGGAAKGFGGGGVGLRQTRAFPRHEPANFSNGLIVCPRDA